MSTLSYSHKRLTVVDQVFARAFVTDALLVITSVALTAALAQVSIPLWPVPITGQTLAVLLVGATLGATRGTLSMLLYSLVGLAGVPVFAEASSGWSSIAGPSGGYLVGFVLAAWITGWCAERTWDNTFMKAAVVFGAGTLVTFACGLVWLAASLGLDLEQTLAGGLYPFVVGGIVKALIAAGVLRFSWKMVSQVKRRDRSGDVDRQH